MVERTHHYCVYFKDFVFPTLPKGSHGAGDKEIELGVVKKMFRMFGILECAKLNIEQLR